MLTITIISIIAALISVGSIALQALNNTKNGSKKITILSKACEKIEINADENNPAELIRSVGRVSV